jgi:hypothetical protein
MSRPEPKAKNKGGRPTTYSPALAENICEWIAEGRTLREFCRQDGAPSWRVVYVWLEKEQDFAIRYGLAREMGFDAIAEDTLGIIDTEPDVITSEGGSRRDGAHVAWLKNRVEQRMKLLAKWNPKRYGDKVGFESAGNVSLTVVTGVPGDE